MDDLSDAFTDQFLIPTHHAEEFEISACISTHIYQVKWKGGPTVVKRTPINEAKHTSRLLQSLDHPHIIKLVDLRLDVSFGYIIMEIAGSVRLSEIITNLTIPPLQIVVQLTSACQHMHDRCVRHGSISTETIMLSQVESNVQAKFISFGCASFTGFCDFGVKKQPPHPAFTAPEIITSSQATCAADIWSVGLVIFAMLSQKPVSTWGSDARSFVIDNIPLAPPGAAFAIRSCLRIQAKNRFSAAMLHSMIEELIPTEGSIQPQPISPIDAVLWEQPHAAAQLLVACTETPASILPCFDALLSHMTARWNWECSDSVIILRAFTFLFGQAAFFTDQPPILMEQLMHAGATNPEIVTNLLALLLHHHNETYVEFIRKDHVSVTHIACLGACVAMEAGTPMDYAVTVFQAIEANHPIAKLLSLIRTQVMQAQATLQQARSQSEAAAKCFQAVNTQMISIRLICNTNIQQLMPPGSPPHQGPLPPPPPPA